MEVGDALGGVHHRHVRAVLVGVGDGLADALGGLGVELVQAGLDGGQAVVRVQAGGRELVAVLREEVGEVGLHHVAEDHRVGHLHHGGLEVGGEQQALLLGALDLLGEERVEGLGGHERAVHDLALEDLQALLEDLLLPVLARELDGQHVVGREGHRLLVGPEVVCPHGGDGGLGVLAPLAHRVRELLGVALDRLGGTAVGVALAEHRVHGGALDGVVARLGVLLPVRLRLVRVVGQRIAVGLQLLDRGAQLRHGGGDVRQLDDVGLGSLHQRAELGESIVGALPLGQDVPERGQDAAGQGDVPGLELDARGAGIRAHDRQQGGGCQHGRLVGQRVDDLRHAVLSPSHGARTTP